MKIDKEIKMKTDGNITTTIMIIIKIHLEGMNKMFLFICPLIVFVIYSALGFDVSSR